MSNAEDIKNKWRPIAVGLLSAAILGLELYRFVVNPDFLVVSLGNADPLLAAIATLVLVISIHHQSHKFTK